MRLIEKKFFVLCVSIVAAVSFYSCSPAAPKLSPEQKFIEAEKIQVNGTTTIRQPKVDILFVVDRSGSMYDYQANLSTNIDLFLNQLSTIDVDYQIGVLTSDGPDEYDYACDYCSPPVAEDYYYFGKLQGSVKIVTPQTPDAIAQIKKNILVGTSGDAREVFFNPIMKGLSSEYLNSGGENAGFIRDEAHLAVVFLTDAEEQSEGTSPQQVYDFLVELKKSENKLLSYGIIIPTSYQAGGSCTRDEGAPVRFEEFLLKTVNGGTGKNVMNICSQTFGNDLTRISKDLSRYLSGTIYLNQRPVLSTMSVHYNGIALKSDFKTGWFYDPKINAIIIGNNVDLDNYVGDGSGMKVNFSIENSF
jgi:hypothetical protein